MIVGQCFQLLPGGAFFITIFCRGFKFLFGNGLLFGCGHGFEQFFQLAGIRRRHYAVQAGGGPGFIHNINSFIGQKTAGNIAVGKQHRRFNGACRIADVVMIFISFLQALQYLDRLRNFRRIDNDRLKTPFQGCVLFNTFPVFIQRGCANALQFPARKCRFDDIGRIHCSFGAAGTHNGVQFVNKEDHFSGSAHFVQYRFDAFFKLTAVLGARHHQGKIQSKNHFVVQKFRYGFVDDRLCQTFDDSSFAHPGFTDQHRVVFGAAAENLDGALYFIFAPDHRIKRSLGGKFGQIAAESIQSRQIAAVARLGIAVGIAVFAGIAAVVGQIIRVEGGKNHLPHRINIGIQIAQRPCRCAFPIPEQRQQQMFGTDKTVIHRFGFHCRQQYDALQSLCQRRIAHFLHCRRTAAGVFFHLFAQLLQTYIQMLENFNSYSFVERKQPQQQMFCANAVAVEPLCFFFGKNQCPFGTRGQIAVV